MPYTKVESEQFSIKSTDFFGGRSFLLKKASCHSQTVGEQHLLPGLKHLQ